MHLRLGVVAERCRFGEPGKHIKRGERPRAVENARGVGGHTRAQRFEEFQFALDAALVRAQYFFFVLLECGSNEALASRDSLLAMVVRRHRMQVRFRNLDVVTEYAIEPDLERLDTGARALALFHLGDDLFA